MDRNNLLDTISLQFGALQHQLNARNAIISESSDAHAVTLMKRLLNAIFDLNLDNSAHRLARSPGVDLIDMDKGVAFQLTASSTLEQLRCTVENFIQSELIHQCPKFYIYILTEKGHVYKQEHLANWTQGRLTFDVQKHILDWRGLLGLLQQQSIGKIEQVAAILDEELSKRNNEEDDLRVAVSFAPADLEWVSKVVGGLMLNRIQVYTNVSALKEYLSNARNARYLTLDNGADEDNLIEHCAVFLTNNYYDAYLKFSGRECPLLKRAHGRRDRVITFLLREDTRIPRFDAFDLYDTNRKVSKADFQRVIQHITDRVNKDAPKFEDYEDFLTILRQAERKAVLKEFEPHNDAVKKIGYRLVESYDKLKDDLCYYLFLYSTVNHKNTREYLEQAYPHIIGKTRNLFILLKWEKSHKDYKTRFENLAKAFEAKKVMYIDEFINEYCNAELGEPAGRNKFLHISNFVYPKLREYDNSEIQNISILREWLNDITDSPIFVLRGGGGIGKSTLIRQMADEFQMTKPNARIAFVEVGEIVERLIHIFYHQNRLDLYHFYEAFIEDDEPSGKLDATQFRLHLDSGNLLIVLDGLDEIMSKLPNFSIDLLFDSAIALNNKSGRGRILITCRNYYWEEEENKIRNLPLIESYEILPFDASMAEEFFEKKYPADRRKVEKCMRLAREFSSVNKGKEEFIPFVLDVVDTMLAFDGYIDEADNRVSDSGILNPKDNRNDYIVERILFRESRRIGQVDVDSQIRFFIEMAIFEGGMVKSDELSTHFNLLDIAIPESSVKAFNAHPFLTRVEDSLVFKYDFFDDYFSSIYLSGIISGQQHITENLLPQVIKILAKDCKYNSGLLKESRKRIDTRKPEVLNRATELLTLIVKQKNPRLTNINEIRKAVSGLFTLALYANHFWKANDKRANTNLLIELFGSGGRVIQNLCIDDLPESEHILFDFSGLDFIDAFFQNYPSFLDCTFDAKTYFHKECILHGVTRDGKTTATPTNFDLAIDAIGMILDCLKKNNSNTLDLDKNRKRAIRDALQTFFRPFFQNGQPREKLLTQEVEIYFRRHAGRDLPFKKLVELLLNRKILLVRSTTDRGDIARINDKHLPEINRFHQSGLLSPVLNSVITDVALEENAV